MIKYSKYQVIYNIMKLTFRTFDAIIFIHFVVPLQLSSEHAEAMHEILPEDYSKRNVS
jgi:hypothetical protein